MPSLDLTRVFDNLPELTSLHLQNIDEFKVPNFQAVYKKLTTYKGLEKLALELVSFDLWEIKAELVEILRIHSDTLKYFSLARNKVSSDLMKYLCGELSKGFNVLEVVDLKHLKENGKVNHPELLQCIAGMLSGEKRRAPVRVYLSEYQTQLKRAAINEYMSKAKPNIELHFE
jgi:hypothetical protein